MQLPPAVTPAAPVWREQTPNISFYQRRYVEARLARLLQNQFQLLERSAIDAPHAAPRDNLGVTMDDDFYDTFKLRNWSDNPDWSGVLTKIDGWEAAYPATPNAKLARAVTFTAYAWEARGADPANVVKKDGWRLFEQRLATALVSLEEIKALPNHKTAAFWVAYLDTLFGLSFPSKKYLAAADQAIFERPEEPKIYYTVCVYLHPRWLGKPGEWPSWLKQQTERSSWGDQGMPDQLYARIICLLDRRGDVPEMFSDASVSWRKTSNGLDELCARFPESVYWRTVRAKLAYTARNKAVLRSSLDAMDGTFDSLAMTEAQLHEAVRWAEEK